MSRRSSDVSAKLGHMSIEHPPRTPLPEDYRLAVLDDVADRDAVILLDRWGFAFDFAPEDLPHLVWDLEPGRTLGIWHEPEGRDRELAAVCSSYAFAMQVPGGATVPTGGLTWVAVHPGHRRRGLARALLHAHLRRTREAGEVVSALYAAETGIYGRYGYEIAAHRVSLSLGRGAGLRDVPGTEELHVDLQTFDAEAHGPVLDEVQRAARRPGWITRDTEALRASHLVDWPSARRDNERLRVAIVRDRDGRARGYAEFRRSEKWSDDESPEGTVKIRESVTLDAAASRALWGVLTDLDLMATTKVPSLAVDDPLVHQLTDLRGAGLRRHDQLWLRLLDVPGALRARRVQAPVDLVLEVRDELVPENAGAWRIRGQEPEAGHDGLPISVERTQDAPDLTLDVTDLAAVYLGGTSLGAIARAGRVTEHTPGSVLSASAALDWPVKPWMAWSF